MGPKKRQWVVYVAPALGGGVERIDAERLEVIGGAMLFFTGSELVQAFALSSWTRVRENTEHAE